MIGIIKTSVLATWYTILIVIAARIVWRLYQEITLLTEIIIDMDIWNHLSLMTGLLLMITTGSIVFIYLQLFIGTYRKTI